MSNSSGILAGKKILVTGVLTDGSIAFHIARIAQEEGADVILSSFGRAMSITQRISARLPKPAPVIELDVTNEEHLTNLAPQIKEHLGQIDGIVHAIAFAPETALGGNFLKTEWQDVSTAVQVSAFSLKSLTVACKSVFGPSVSVVGLDFDGQQAFPIYDWMGVAKAALEATMRYLARDLGKDNVRINLVSAGPLKTVAAKSIPGFEKIEHLWNSRSALRWDVSDPVPTAKAAVALLSDWFPMTTAEIIHVDGGFHAMAGQTSISQN